MQEVAFAHDLAAQTENVFRKILFDRLLFAPPFLFVFFVFVSLLQV